MLNPRQGFHAVRVWGRDGGRFCFSSLMQKAALVCFLLTLEDTGFKFSRRVETDGRASWCMANGGTKTRMQKKKNKKNLAMYFLSSNVTTYCRYKKIRGPRG